MKPKSMLFGAIAVAPIAWLLNLEANFALAPLACAGGSKTPLYVISVISLLLVVSAEIVSLSLFRRPEHQTAGKFTPDAPHTYALAIAGIGLNGLSVLAILAQAIPNLMLSGCQ